MESKKGGEFSSEWLSLIGVPFYKSCPCRICMYREGEGGGRGGG